MSPTLILSIWTAVLVVVAANLTIYFGGSPMLAISLAALTLVVIANYAFYAGKREGIRMVADKVAEKLQRELQLYVIGEDKEAIEDAIEEFIEGAIEEVRRAPFKMPPSLMDYIMELHDYIIFSYLHKCRLDRPRPNSTLRISSRSRIVLDSWSQYSLRITTY